MSAEKLVDLVAETTERRGLLQKAGAASLGAFLGIMGLDPDRADALVYTHGCQLCREPVGQCNNCPSSVTCIWCWLGDCHGPANFRHRNNCCEGKTRNSHCHSDCHYVACSCFGGPTHPC